MLIINFSSFVHSGVFRLRPSPLLIAFLLVFGTTSTLFYIGFTATGKLADY